MVQRMQHVALNSIKTCLSMVQSYLVPWETVLGKAQRRG